MGLWNICTMRWLLATGSGLLASKSSRLPLLQRSFARERAPSSSTIPKSSFPWCSRRLGHQVGSWRPLTRRQGPTCLCNLVTWGMCFELLDWGLFLNHFVRDLAISECFFWVLFYLRILENQRVGSLSLWFPKSLFCFHIILLWDMIVKFLFRRVESPRLSDCGSWFPIFGICSVFFNGSEIV